MIGLVDIEGHDEPVVSICPQGTLGEVIDISGLPICLPKKPKKKDIAGYDLPTHLQSWNRTEMPKELSRIKSMDEWYERPKEFRQQFSLYVEEEFRRRREGYWFYNDGEPHTLLAGIT